MSNNNDNTNEHDYVNNKQTTTSTIMTTVATETIALSNNKVFDNKSVHSTPQVSNTQIRYNLTL